MALAGALGAVSRWGLSRAVVSVAGDRSHVGTLTVNVLGCLLFGLLFALFEQRIADESHLRLFFFVGFLGAFTTFSTFAHDSHHLLTNHGIIMAGVNLLLSVTLGWGAFVLGLVVGRAI